MNKGRPSLSCDWEKLIVQDIKPSNIPTRFSFYHTLGETSEDEQEPKIVKPPTDFCTESSYAGQWDSLGMSGYGTYTFPHGVEYEGEFKDGMFHGEGTLIYPMGQKVEGMWIDGTMVSFTFRYADGLEHGNNWEYCTMPDRRFYIEICEGFKPAGREYLTNEQPTRRIPEGCYDTGKGFFNATTKCITGALDSQDMYRRIKQAKNPKMEKVVGDVYERPQVQIATDQDEAWITENCRKAWDEKTGFRPDLYEVWMSGSSVEAGFEVSDMSIAIDSKSPSEASVAMEQNIQLNEIHSLDEDNKDESDSELSEILKNLLG